MGSVLCCPCRTVAKIFSPSKTFGTVLCCLPLSLFALIVSAVIGAYSGFELQITLQAEKYDVRVIMNLLLQLIQAITAVVGFIAVIFRWAAGASCLTCAYKVLVASWAVTALYRIVVLIIELINKKKVAHEFIVTIVLYIVFLIFSWWILSCFSSLQKIFSVGGHGWECKNYKEIVKDRANDLERKTADDEL